MILTMTEGQIKDLRRDKETLQADKTALLDQLVTKDRQIERFFSSERETKTLFGRLQSFMNNALKSGRLQVDAATYVPETEVLESGLEHIQENEGR